MTFCRKHTFKLLICLLLSGCAPHQLALKGQDTVAKKNDFLASLRSSKSAQMTKEEIDGLALLFEGQYKEANEKFMQAAKIHPKSSMAHFLNALCYHLRAKEFGETEKLELAGVGYDLALKFNPNNAFAAFYKGVLEFEQNNYPEAQILFSKALLGRPQDAKLLHALAISAYYNKDMPTALGAIEQALKAQPNEPKYLHAAALIHAAAGQGDQAKTIAHTLAKKANGSRRLNFVQKRIGEWGDFHAHLKKASFSLPSVSLDASSTANPYSYTSPTLSTSSTSTNTSTKKMQPNDMVIVDIVLILTRQAQTSQRGMNLLKELSVSFGDPANTSQPAGFGFYNSRAAGSKLSEGSVNTLPSYQQMLTQITFPAVTYSLNISNSLGEKSEVIARPSLLARHGKTSKFFNGVDITYTVGATMGASTQEKKVGINLEVTPQLLKDGRVNLKLALERQFLMPVNGFIRSTSSATSLQTSATSLNSDVVMNMGDTLILGGLSDRLYNEQTDGTDGLSSLPLIGLLFSKEVKETEYSSVIVLVTPRMPQYTYQSPESLEKSFKTELDFNQSVLELKARYIDWFKPYDNLGSVFRQLQSNQLYREFRTGDVQLDNWSSIGNVLPEIEEAVEYVY